MSIFKKIFTNLTPPKVLMILACVLSSLCTTAYVTNVYTLRPIWLSPPLIFLGVFAVQRILLYLAGRNFKSVPSFQVILLSVTVAVLIIVVCRNVFFPTQRDLYIAVTAETAG